MKDDIKNILKIAGTYVGTVLGAGFASGQEVLSFFLIYGHRGLYGLVLASIIFALMGAIVLNKIYVNQISSFDAYVYPLIGERIGKMTETLVCLFMLSSFCVMSAGSGAIFYEEFGIGKNIGILIMIGICLIVFLNDIKGVVVINSVLAPLMFLGITFLGIYIMVFDSSATMVFKEIIEKSIDNWVASSLVYVSYNTLTLIVIMTALLPFINKRKIGIIGGILGGLVLGVIAIIIFSVLIIFYPDIMLYEIPFLYVVVQKGRIIELIYVFVLYSAMLTTAVANGYGLISKMDELLKIRRKTSTILFCIFSFFLAKVGFANLVNVLYPLFGYMGLFLVIIILLDGLKEFLTEKFNIR
jgi:uncharacterized membrane protein YkvI